MYIKDASIELASEKSLEVSFSAFQDLGHDFNLSVWDNVIEFAEIALDAFEEG